MNQPPFVAGWLWILAEALEGGKPGQGTGFLDSTAADGSGNRGLFATLAGLNAAQASNPTTLGLSVAGHAAHVAYHMEASVRYARGDRGPFDWDSSFQPNIVDEAGWKSLQTRVRAAHDAVLQLASETQDWTEDTAGGLAATLAHVTYHLGAIRQTIKLV